MGTPNMDHDSSQSAPLTSSQSSQRDRSTARRMRSNSFRDQPGSDREGQTSRASSVAKSDKSPTLSQFNKARGPVNDALHSALDPIDPNHTAFSPEIINQLTTQITANVLQQLKASQSPNPTPRTTTERMDSIPPFSGSPPTDRDRVYTPPSPYRASEEAAQTESPTSPRKHTKFPLPSDSRRPPSPPFSHATLSEDSDAREGAHTKSRAERAPSGDDTTILEKIWGNLFDEQGRSTTRLSQFLRGVAVHLIEDYEPKHSLVITPDKMQKYYEETKLSNEIYPWQVIFDDRTSSISRLFREIEVQHHLVQDRLDERPDIPGMTPIGFETWMTLVLKAHPDQEFERLAHTALHMPITNPDDKKERFPKELSRRQFPRDPDNAAVANLQKVLYTHCGVRVAPRSGSISERDGKTSQAQATTRTQLDPQQQANGVPHKSAPFDNPLAQSTSRSSMSDIDRSNLRATVSEVAIDDAHIEVAPPIERQRKPYVAQPGGGKTYDCFDAQMSQAAENKTNQYNQAQPPPVKLTRSASVNAGRPSDTKARPVQPIAVHQKPAAQVPPPVDIPPPSRNRAGSTYYRDGVSRNVRNRSPSISRTTEPPHKSDGDMPYGSYQSTSSSDFAPNARRTDGRYDQRGSFSVEPRERDREPRQRYHSVSNSEGHRYHPKDHPSDDEYHRPSNVAYVGPDSQYVSQYPPNSYKGRAA